MADLDKFLKIPSDPTFLLLEADVAPAEDYMRRLVSGGLIARTLRGRKMRTVQGLMDEVGAALQFPSYFGENWPALDECLSDMDWLLPADAFAVLLEDSDQVLGEADADELRTFAEILTDAMLIFAEPIDLGEIWDRPSIPFHFILQAEARNRESVVQRWTKAGVSIEELRP